MIAALNTSTRAADIAASQTATACTTSTTCRCSSREETERRQMWTQFAAAALAGLVAKHDHDLKHRDENTFDEVAERAYWYATELMDMIHGEGGDE